ncbi:hypothetical protein FRC07_001724 [Ceratobasidium sp. 392]|nr:hypothetical protein FRC07_001724 [Ceratobasidium sp. 392]
MFDEAKENLVTGSRYPRWEGDQKILEVLGAVRELHSATIDPSDQDVVPMHLQKLKNLADNDESAKMIWEYGGISLLLKIAGSKTDLARDTVRAVLGMGGRLSLGNELERTGSTLSINANDSPTGDEQTIPPFLPALQADPEYGLKIIRDVIPRLHDLLMCDPSGKSELLGNRPADLPFTNTAVNSLTSTSDNTAGGQNFLGLVQIAVEIIVDLSNEGDSSSLEDTQRNYKSLSK